MSLLNQYLKTIGQGEAGYGLSGPLPSMIRNRKKTKPDAGFWFSLGIGLLVSVLALGATVWRYAYGKPFGIMRASIEQPRASAGGELATKAENLALPTSTAVARFSGPVEGQGAVDSQTIGDRFDFHPAYSRHLRIPGGELALSESSTSQAHPNDRQYNPPLDAERGMRHTGESRGGQKQPSGVEAGGESGPTPQEEAESLYQQGLLAFEDGKLADAEHFLLETLKKAPRDLGALINLSNLYIRQDRLDLAERTLQQIQKIDKDNTGSLNNLGVIALRRNNHENARVCFIRSLEINPADETALSNLAYMAQSENNGAEAQRYYEKIISANPQNADAFVKLAHLKEQEGQLEYALRLYAQCMKLQGVQNDPGLSQKIRDRIHLLRNYN